MQCEWLVQLPFPLPLSTVFEGAKAKDNRVKLSMPDMKPEAKLETLKLSWQVLTATESNKAPGCLQFHSKPKPVANYDRSPLHRLDSQRASPPHQAGSV